MATIRKIPVQWGGLAALPGYSVFYSLGSADVTTDLATFFNVVKGLLPGAAQITIPPAGDTIDDATGALVGTWTGTGTVIAGGGSSGAYAAGVGGYVVWNTGTVVGRRRLKGRTFLCPLVTGAYDSSGTLDNGNRAVIAGAASTLATAGKLVIWHRPAKITHVGGSSALIVSGVVPDQVTSLRSRRY